jgi:hypothetical protein
MSNLVAAMCPHCHTDAPLVYRGIKAYCSACGRPRAALSGSSLTHAGKPAKLGGTIVHVFGWAALAVGLLVSMLLGGVVGLLGAATGWFSGMAGLLVGGLLALFSLGVFLLLRLGGNKLEHSADETLEQRREQALRALAKNRGGVLQAADAAAALDMPLAEADALLTRLAKQQPEETGVEIGQEGQVLYTFSSSAWGAGASGAATEDARMRFDASPSLQADDRITRIPCPSQPDPDGPEPEPGAAEDAQTSGSRSRG